MNTEMDDQKKEMWLKKRIGFRYSRLRSVPKEIQEELLEELKPYYDRVDSNSKTDSGATVEACIQTMLRLAAFTKKPLKQTTEEDMIKYKSALKKRGRHAQTRDLYIIAEYYEFVNEPLYKFIKKNKIPVQPTDSKTGKPTATEEEKNLLLGLRLHESEIKQLRYELEVQCLWNWGCRRRSLVYLKENDIDYTKRKVRITTTKTGQPYWVGVDTETINLLKRYLKVRPKSRDHWVFTNDNGERLNEQSVSKEIQHAREMLKEKGFDVKSTPHSFRRSSVLGMVQQNLQPTAIMRLHGMRSVKMIDVYAKDLDIDDIIEVQRDRENWYKKIEAKKNEK